MQNRGDTVQAEGRGENEFLGDMIENIRTIEGSRAQKIQ
jgi:hypothetical protein